MVSHELLNDVFHEHRFKLKDGGELKNIAELSKEIHDMPDNQFSHHVNDKRNDFYNWVLHCVKDGELAENIKDVKSKVEMSGILNERVSELKAEKTKANPKFAKRVARGRQITAKQRKAEREREKMHPYHTHKHHKNIVDEWSHVECDAKKHMKCGMVEFSFGMVIGLTGGLVLAKVLGII